MANDLNSKEAYCGLSLIISCFLLSKLALKFPNTASGLLDIDSMGCVIFIFGGGAGTGVSMIIVVSTGS